MKCYIVCHRGYFREKENQIDSILEVQRLDNYNEVGVEFDIQITKDETLVCYHDKTLNRLHGVDLDLFELTYNDIRKYKIGTFDDLLEGINDNGLKIIDIELKLYDNCSIEISKYCKKVVDRIKKYGIEKRCVITSMDVNIVFELLQMHKNLDKFCSLKIGYILHDNYDKELLDKLYGEGLEYLVVNKYHLKVLLESKYIKLFNLMFYTFFDDCDKFENDKQLIDAIKKSGSKIGIITDNYQKTLKEICNE